MANPPTPNANRGNESGHSTTSSASSADSECRVSALQPPHFEDCRRFGLKTPSDVTSAAWAAGSLLGYELCTIFFDKLSIGLLNRPQFMARYNVYANGQGRFVGREQLQKDEIFMISGIFALAARFSDSVEFVGIPAAARGSSFGSDAATLSENIVARYSENPTLTVLCGCVVLAMFYLSDGQLGHGSKMISTCLRYAYDLNLHTIDVQDLEQPGDAVTIGHSETDFWIATEQRRRIWWNIWKIEVFSSSMACKPCSIDLRDIAVRLPVADVDWFAKRPVESAILIDHPRTAWKTLSEVGSENPLAWFLLGLYLVSQANTALRRPMRPQPDLVKELSSSICCFKLALPKSLALESIFFDKNDAGGANWAVQMHIIIVTAESMINDLRSQEGSSLSEHWTPMNIQHRHEAVLFSIVQVWPSSFIPLSEPLICGALGRAAALATRSDSCFQTKDICRLLLARFAAYWELAQVILSATEAAESVLSLGKSQKEHLYSRLKFLWPSRVSEKSSDICGAGTFQGHYNSIHDDQPFSVEGNGEVRLDDPLDLSNGPALCDRGSPWRYSAIFANFLDGGVGEWWQQGNIVESIDRGWDNTSNYDTSFGSF